jgi:glycosyltransferase involved in cell wall biosynthesis
VRILILTQYYPPERGAPQNRLSDMAQRLMASGHSVTVLTALPNYPTGKIFREYTGKLLLEERLQGIRVIRTWIYATKKKNFAYRLLNYFSFVCSSFVFGAWKIGSADVIVVESPPLFLGLSGFLLSIVKRARLVFNVSDLWPESAVAMGVLKSKPLIRLSTWLEEFLYRQSSLITGQTEGIVDSIRARFPGKKIALITNGVDVRTFLGTSNPGCRCKIRAEFGWNDNFVIGYAGLHGLAQGLEIILGAASRLREQKEIVFALFGDGPEKERLRRVASELKLTNVRFYDSEPTSRIPAILTSVDLAVIPLRKLEIFKGALPSKMFEAMAAGAPLVVSVEGEAKQLVERAQCGLCVEAEDPQALAEAILFLFQNHELLKTFGLNGQRYVTEHYDRQKIADRFERLLLDFRGPHEVPEITAR